MRVKFWTNQGASRREKANQQSRILAWAVFWCAAHLTSVALGITFNVSLASLTNHNTSAFSSYDQAGFPANFGTNSWVSQSGATIAVDPSKMDESLNAITPGHVSGTDVHTLIPSRPDLRWFAHATPWFGSSSHINIGLTNDTSGYVQAMIADMQRRGFNGVVIDWYGQNHSTDGVVQKIKAYLASLPNNKFTYIIMLDKGVQGGLGTNNLAAQIQYCQNQYFNDPNYEHEPLTTGKPILMFFGVRSVLGAGGMAALKSQTGGNMVWVEQGTGYLAEPWEDECFEWTEQFNNGVNASDPFNLAGVTRDYSAIRSSGKKAFGSMCGNFNGTLTKSVNWSMGKYLPSSNGLCVVERAAAINAAIPANITRMQWATWSDWEEGTQVESGIENNVSLAAQVNASELLSWKMTTGDPKTVDHYEIYASTNGLEAAFLGSVPADVDQTNLSQTGLARGNYQLYVEAVGKPCIRDHLSAPVPFALSDAPVLLNDIQPLWQRVWEGDPVSFSVLAGGTPPLNYQWALNGQGIPGATNATYSSPALAGTNHYRVTVSNPLGTVGSGISTVVGVVPTYLNVAAYDTMRISFSGFTNASTLTNFPVLVRLGTNIPGFSYSQFVSPADGADLRFAGADGRELASEIDEWNPAGESEVWVQVPRLGSTNDYITAFWGNPSDRTMPPSNTNGAVWRNLSGSIDFLLVYHLSHSGFPFADSTQQYPADAGVAPALASGPVGHGAAFDGSSDFLDAGFVNLGKVFTVSAWVNIAPRAMNEQTIWCNKQGGWNTAGFDFYVNSYQTNDGKIYFDTADGTGGNVSPRTAAQAVGYGRWHLLTGTLDGTNGAVRVYVDGADQTINSGVDTAFQTTNDLRCGALLTGNPGATGGLCFNGAMDELRIEKGVRSPAWVWASWATVAESNFASFGPIFPAAVALHALLLGGQCVLTWTSGTLQSSSRPEGPYADFTGASSPFTPPRTNLQEYFRLRVSP